MLEQNVGILSPTSQGSGQYSFELHFQSSSQAKFLRVGDTVEDSNSNQYEILYWSTQPSDFASGNVVTTQFITADTLPAVDSVFDSIAFTPGQVDVTPEVRTSGNIFNINFHSGQNYEYELSASWVQTSEASKAQVGDRIVDNTGKEYEITFLDGTDRFSVPFRMKEVEAVGQTPAAASATLYRPTSNFNLFQGSELTDPARTVIFNRDKVLIDLELGSRDSGIQNTYLNNSGSDFDRLTVLRQDSFGNLQTVDPSVEAQVFNIVGVSKEDIDDGTTGDVVIVGLIPNISILFSVGDSVYLSKTGGLINTVPEIGSASFVSGDFVVYIGQISKNPTNPGNKDLIVDVQIKGQL